MRRTLSAIVTALTLLICNSGSVRAQAPGIIGQCNDTARGQAFALRADLFMFQIGNPMNSGFAVRDPSGMMFLRMPASNPMYQAFFLGWNGQLIEINPNGAYPIGFCSLAPGVIPPNPNAFAYQPPAMSGGHFVTGAGGTQTPVPAAMAQAGSPFGRPLITSEQKVAQCVSQNSDQNAITNCVVRSMLGTRERRVYDCSRNNTDKTGFAICSVGALGGSNEQQAAQQLGKCYKEYGQDYNKYPLCMAEQNADPNTARLLSCVQKQAESGSVTWTGTAVCYGVGSLQLNPELQIAAECAATSGGQPYVFAGCAGGQLTARELTKCMNQGFGGSGCFGPNNEVVKGLRALGVNINDAFGPENTIVKTWNQGINDLQNGPGPNNDAIKFTQNVANDIAKGPGENNDIKKAVKKVLPFISF